MQKIRKGENTKLWFRSERIFSTQNQWYFSTREGVAIGPFTTRCDANYGLALFTDFIRQHNNHFHYAQQVATQGLWSVSYRPTELEKAS